MREWTGCVWPAKGPGPFSAKWKEWGTEKWRRTSGFPTRTEASDFLAEKRRDYRQKRRGDHDPFEEPRRRAIAKHIEDFHGHILGNRKRRHDERTKRHANQSKQRLVKAFADMKVKCFADLSAHRVDKFLASLIDSEGMTVKTRNDYAATMRQFTRWAAGDARLERDLLTNVRFLDNAAGPAKKQTFTWEVVQQIAAGCIQRPLQMSPAPLRDRDVAAGKVNALAITLMFLTGLRNSELAAMQWGWVSWTDRYIEVPFHIAKSGRTECIPLHDGLALLLQDERRRRAVAAGRPVADSELVIGKLSTHLNDRLRRDLSFLKMPAIDQRGRTFSLYAMRGSFATQLDALGVPEGLVKDLMRHTPPDVTRQHYVQRSLPMLLAAINAIPVEAAFVPGLYEGPRQGPREAANPVEPRRTANAPNG